mmetsp:Transcript_14911/g.42829  ORF Transcript_14911/g.42829 Transcript_14911/m.42829 type:complete len:187 (+) Transcript_14911:112-672(+)
MSTFMRVCLASSTHGPVPLPLPLPHTDAKWMSLHLSTTRKPQQHTQYADTLYTTDYNRGAGKKVLRHPQRQKGRRTDRRMNSHTNYASARTQTHTLGNTASNTQGEREMDKGSLYTITKHVHSYTDTDLDTDRHCKKPRTMNNTHTHTHSPRHSGRQTGTPAGQTGEPPSIELSDEPGCGVGGDAA